MYRNTGVIQLLPYMCNKYTYKTHVIYQNTPHILHVWHNWPCTKLWKTNETDQVDDLEICVYIFKGQTKINVCR